MSVERGGLTSFFHGSNDRYCAQKNSAFLLKKSVVSVFISW